MAMVDDPRLTLFAPMLRTSERAGPINDFETRIILKAVIDLVHLERTQGGYASFPKHRQELPKAHHITSMKRYTVEMCDDVAKYHPKLGIAAKLRYHLLPQDLLLCRKLDLMHAFSGTYRASEDAMEAEVAYIGCEVTPRHLRRGEKRKASQ